MRVMPEHCCDIVVSFFCKHLGLLLHSSVSHILNQNNTKQFPPSIYSFLARPCHSKLHFM
jgi:hypothetical protein